MDAANAERHTMRQGHRIIGSIGDLADQYDGLIVDLFGTLHDGIDLLPGVLGALRDINQRHIRICLLSNAPRRRAQVVEQIDRMGLEHDFYCGLITSGEMVFEALAAGSSSLGDRYFHIGPAELSGLLHGSGRSPVADIDEADFLLCTGIGHGPSVSRDPFARAIERKLVMVCANPDRSVMIGQNTIACAGMVAERYEGMGGTVWYFGKPHRAAYDGAFSCLGIPAKRILAVGDALETDVRGANAAGIDAALVLTGIDGHLVFNRQEGRVPWNKIAALRNRQHRPTFVVRAFARAE